MKVREVMKNVKTISEDLSIKEAAKKMNRYNIGSLIVVGEKNNKQRISGILTERDILKKVTAQDKIPSKTLISNIMTLKVITVNPDNFIDDAVYLMIKNKIKKLPVLENEELIGMITSTDIISHSDEIGQYYLFG